MLVQSLTEVYYEKSDQAWGWLFQNILPTLTLMVTIFSYEAMKKENAPKEKKETTDVFFYRLTFYVSITYLFLLFLTLILQPFVLRNTDLTRIELLNQSNLWLGPLQGITTGLLGIFFVKSER